MPDVFTVFLNKDDDGDDDDDDDDDDEQFFKSLEPIVARYCIAASPRETSDCA